VTVDGSVYRDLTLGASTDNLDPAWDVSGANVIYEAFNASDRQRHETRIVGKDGAGDSRYSSQLRPYGLRSAISQDGMMAAYDSVTASTDTLVLYVKGISIPKLPPRRLTVTRAPEVALDSSP
jgi:hypothetical protein